MRHHGLGNQDGTLVVLTTVCPRRYVSCSITLIRPSSLSFLRRTSPSAPTRSTSSAATRTASIVRIGFEPSVSSNLRPPPSEFFREMQRDDRLSDRSYSAPSPWRRSADRSACPSSRLQTMRSNSALERPRRALSSSLASPGPKIRRALGSPAVIGAGGIRERQPARNGRAHITGVLL